MKLKWDTNKTNKPKEKKAQIDTQGHVCPEKNWSLVLKKTIFSTSMREAETVIREMWKLIIVSCISDYYSISCALSQGNPGLSSVTTLSDWLHLLQGSLTLTWIMSNDVPVLTSLTENATVSTNASTPPHQSACVVWAFESCWSLMGVI